MTTNLNANPYYDDFSEDKQFYQLLFRPGFSVQARELTQLQSILRDQIAKFGSHMFKHGSIVLPGNSFSDLNLCYVKLVDTAFDVSTLEGKTVTGGTSGLKALIHKGINKETVNGTTDPSTLYVAYSNSGTNGEKVFLDSEILTVENTATTFTTATSATGGASMAYINKGVYFVNGTFATVEKQSVVIGKYTSTPSCHVLLQIVESIVTSDDDVSLLDPAQGSYNYAAPGADRLKIDLVLTTLQLTDTISSDYIEIMRYNVGVLEEHSRYPKYNELEKSLARRTYDESGDYVTTGLKTTVREHLRVGSNLGRYDAPIGNADKFLYSVSAGKAYIHGFENETLASTLIVSDKARGANHIQTNKFNLNPSYGQFFYVTMLRSMPSLKQRTTIILQDIVGGTTIGSAKLLAVDYYDSGTSDDTAIYKMYVTDVNMVSGGIDNIGAMQYNGTTIATVLQRLSIVTTKSIPFAIGEEVESDIRCGKVIKWTPSTGEMYVTSNCVGEATPNIGDNIIGLTSTAAGKVVAREAIGKNPSAHLLVPLPYNSVYRVKDATNASDISYKIYYEVDVNITGGVGNFTVSGMTIDPAEQGNVLMVTSSGIQPITCASVAPDGASMSFANVTPANGTLKVICSATKLGAVQGSPKTKTLVAAFVQSGIVPATDNLMLNKADVIRINSIVSANTSEGDVTSRYYLDNGQTDYVYGLASIKLVAGKVRPTGNLTVNFDYFNHSAGDYFSVDSYESSGLANYYESPVLMYKSKNNGKRYNLRNVLDFRPRVGDDGTLTSGTAVLNNLVQNDSRITSSVRHYIGRKDVVVMKVDGKMEAIKGVPADKPLDPQIPSDAIKLVTAYIPPYTFSTGDIKLTQSNNRVYTMRDVGSIDRRLKAVEDYVLLSQTEQSVVNMDVTDATTGLSRFKSGYLVDTFNNADIISDATNPQFKVTYQSGKIVPQFEIVESDLIPVDHTMALTGDALTLPYTLSVLAQQNVSSKITNVNPFAVFSWTGKMNIIPTGDSWTDVENLSEIINNTTETRTEVVVTTRPPPPVVIPPPIHNHYNSYSYYNTYNTYIAQLNNYYSTYKGAGVPPPPAPPAATSVSTGSTGGSGNGGWSSSPSAAEPASSYADCRASDYSSSASDSDGGQTSVGGSGLGGGYSSAADSNSASSDSGGGDSGGGDGGGGGGGDGGGGDGGGSSGGGGD